MPRKRIYLHIIILFTCSAPALSSRGTHKSSMLASSDASSRGPWNIYSSEQITKPEFDENSGFDVAAPLLKSFMTQVQLHKFCLIQLYIIFL